MITVKEQKRFKILKKEMERLRVELSRFKALAIHKEKKIKQLENEIMKLRIEFLESQQEKRRSKRVPIRLKAGLISNYENYVGCINNLSKSGLMIIAKTKKSFVPGTKLKLNFKLPSGKILSPNCKVIWSNKTPHNNLTSNLGLELIDSFAESIKYS